MPTTLVRCRREVAALSMSELKLIAFGDPDGDGYSDDPRAEAAYDEIDRRCGDYKRPPILVMRDLPLPIRLRAMRASYGGRKTLKDGDVERWLDANQPTLREWLAEVVA